MKTSAEDNFLYDKLINLFKEIKLIQSGSAIPATLRRHKVIKNYLVEKQKDRLSYIEENFFVDEELNQFAIESYHEHKSTLQNSQNSVNLN